MKVDSVVASKEIYTRLLVVPVGTGIYKYPKLVFFHLYFRISQNKKYRLTYFFLIEINPIMTSTLHTRVVKSIKIPSET